MANTIQDAKITVSLDTEGAKRELADLKKELAVDASKIRVNKVLQRKVVKENQAAQRTAMTKAKGFAQRFGYQGLLKVPDIFRGAVEMTAAGVGAAIQVIPIPGASSAADVIAATIRKVAPKMEMGEPLVSGMIERALEKDSGAISDYFDDPDAEEDRGDPALIIKDALRGLSEKLNRLKREQEKIQNTLDAVGGGVKAQLAVGIPPDWDFFGNLMKWEYNKNDVQVDLRHKINRTVLNSMGRNMHKAMDEYTSRGQ